MVEFDLKAFKGIATNSMGQLDEIIAALNHRIQCCHYY